MLTNRWVGAAAALESVCRNTASPSLVRFHLIGPNVEAHATRTGGSRRPSDGVEFEGDWTLQAMAPACASGGAQLFLYTIAEMTRRVQEAGFVPVWAWTTNLSTSEFASAFTIRPGVWDNSTTHFNPFNLLRFYLPHIEPFRHLDKVIFMDDDVVILGDVERTWETRLEKHAVMSASCHNWVWSTCNRFESSSSLSYLEVPYLGFGRIANGRTMQSAMCESSSDKECIPERLLELLSNTSVIINDIDNIVTPKTLAVAPAFNYGYNLFDMRAWRKFKITEKYVQWMKVSFYYNVFPATSLAFGLGVAMLTKIGHVQCFPKDRDVVQGLGFVDPVDLRNAGLANLRSSFGIHYNGPRKPWDTDNAFAGVFFQYAPAVVKDDIRRLTLQRLDARAKREANNATAFMILTGPRSGSEWFMELLDQHPEICASGESTNTANGFPREALIPGRYSKAFNEAALLQTLSIANINMSKKPLEAPISLLQVAKNVNYAPEALDSGPSLAEQTCQRKFGCTWGNVASLLWHVASNPHLCDGTRDVWTQRAQVTAITHLPLICELRQRAMALLSFEPWSSQNVSHSSLKAIMSVAFRIFFRDQMRTSLRSNDVEFDSPLEVDQLLPCKCGRTDLVIGQKVMHDWIGDGTTFSDRPWGVNYNADRAVKAGDAPMYDLIGALQEVNAKVIIFDRSNMLARFVSLHTANQTSIYHCRTDNCVMAASKINVTVDVRRFRQWVKEERALRERDRRSLASAGILVLELSYENCVEDVQGCIERACDFLDVAKPRAGLASSSSLRRTTTDLESRIANLAEVKAVLDEDNSRAWLNA
jgi:LPS sulfotransferase NodH